MKVFQQVLFFSFFTSINIPVMAMIRYEMFGAIEANDKTYIKKHLPQWAPNRTAIHIEELKGGIGGARLYTISFSEGDPYVARLLFGSFAQEKDWQDVEIAAMQSADQADVGPYIVAAHSKDTQDNEIGYIVMKKINFIPPQTIPWDQSSTYETLGNFLKKMHSQPSVIPVDQQSMYRRVNGIMDYMQKQWQEEKIDGLLNQFAKVSLFYKNAQKALIAQNRTVLVHGDLLLGNLLYDGNRFWAVDWEQSRLVSDPIFDVALVHDCLVPDTHYHDFMKGYCGQEQLPLLKQEHLHLMQAIASCFVGLAYACQKPVSFVKLFHQHTKDQINVGNALHDLACAGFKRETKEDCVVFGTLLFMRGYQWLSPEHLPILERALAQFNANKN